jgi:hypothetical protein
VVGLSLSWRTVGGGVGIVGEEGRSCSDIAHSNVKEDLWMIQGAHGREEGLEEMIGDEYL